MAAKVISYQQNATPVAISQEVFTIDMNASSTALVTPTAIKSIQYVTITPNNSAAEGKGYATSFVPGNPTVTVTSGANTATFIVVVYGSIA